MSSLTFFFVCLVMGVGMYLAIATFNPFPQATDGMMILLDVTASTVKTQLLANTWVTSTVSAVGGGALVSLVKNKIQSVKDAGTAKLTSEMEQNVLGKAGEIRALQVQNQQLTAKLTDASTLQSQLETVTRTLEKKDRQIDELMTEKKELERVLAGKWQIVEQEQGVH